jgi:hypothetical protein
VHVPPVHVPPVHVPPVVVQATHIVAQNDDPNHFLVDTVGDRYDFELIPNIAGADLSAYTFTSIIENADAQFDIVSTQRNNNHYYLTVRYTAPLTAVQRHRAELVVTALEPVSAHQVNTRIQISAQEPFNVVLNQHTDAAELAINGFDIVLAGLIGPLLNGSAKNRLYRTNNVTELPFNLFAILQPWVDGTGRRFIFPFNVPLIQTYNPASPLFFNPIAIKTEAQNDHVMYFVVQYKPAVDDITNELDAVDLTDPRFNTTLKYHALFSDGLPGHAAVNLGASLSVDGGALQHITINPHDGTWSPAVNSPVLKDKILSADPLNPPVSSVTVSTLSNIAAHPNLEIHSVHVLLDDGDFNAFYQYLGAHNFNMHQFLRDHAYDIPAVLQDGINRYRQLFQNHRIVDGVPGGVPGGGVPGGGVPGGGIPGGGIPGGGIPGGGIPGGGIPGGGIPGVGCLGPHDRFCISIHKIESAILGGINFARAVRLLGMSSQIRFAHSERTTLLRFYSTPWVKAVSQTSLWRLRHVAC